MRLLVLIALVGGCTPAPPPPVELPPQAEPVPDDPGDPDYLRARLDSLNAEIDAAIGAARAERVEQCRTIGHGSKPCGGPWRYLVYSAAATDSTELARLVDEHDRTDDRLNRILGIGSGCDVTPRPSVALEEGRCVATPR